MFFQVVNKNTGQFSLSALPIANRLGLMLTLLLLAIGWVVQTARPVYAQDPDWVWQNPLPQGQDLFAVWGSSGSDVFAVRKNGTLLHYDGSSWSNMSSSTTYNYLSRIWGSSGDDVFAVGGGTILYHDGNSWSTMNSGTSGSLTGVWGSSGSDVFAVGSNGTILHYDGTNWSV